MCRKVTLKISKLEDVAELTEKLRKEDISELKALGHEPLEGLLKSFIGSKICKSVFIEGELSAMFGIAKISKGWGMIWMLGSDKLFSVPMSMIKVAKRVINNFLGEYDVLFNQVDTRNVSHVKWLKILGFSFGVSQIINNVEFKQFYKVTKRGK